MESSSGYEASVPFLAPHGTYTHPPILLCPYHHHRHHLHHHDFHQHHHHHLLISPHCRLHNSLLRRNGHNSLLRRNCHSHPSYSYSSPPIPRPIAPKPEVVGSVSPENDQNLERLGHEEANQAGAQLLEDDWQDGLEEDGNEEPELVMTDEWMEFFAKSEAKRRLARKQEKKKCKN